VAALVFSELVCLLGQHMNKKGNKRSKESLQPKDVIKGALCTNCIYSPGKKYTCSSLGKKKYLQ